ncbi:response regulator transcription factor [Tessaracoccus sp. OS52]|uniref:response regulator transcription factor n=1 Tax=Tessaracoccus sp. OS52 TaxID=2886691 RepID=UPI001D106555|nr:response regulator transcription factor [Tessaracoccus sp. OS52]MCC2593944.1 response regulator transcription factor [Tessaracoccus sp. OS52]
MSVTVVLVDDHPVVRAGLRAVLEAAGGGDVVGEAAGVTEAVAVVRATKPQVVLMDLRLGREDGVEATRQILALELGVRVLILTTHDTDADILRAIEAGASGYLLKDAEPEVLAAAVRQAAAGETVLAPLVASRLVGRLQRPPVELTVRELEVLRLTADGLANREIAQRLFVSQATVKTHLVHIFSKLGVDNRTAAVARARERGLVA